MPPISSPWGDQETTDPHVADDRNYFKVEVWTADGQHIERMLHAGNDLQKARDVYAKAEKQPQLWLTIRQRSRVLKERPAGASS